jgi:hypothetical protein
MNLPPQFEEWRHAPSTQAVVDYLEREVIPRTIVALIDSAARSDDPAVRAAWQDWFTLKQIIKAMKGGQGDGK